MIFLVDPNQEGLGIIVVDSSVIRPVPIYSACFKKSVSFLEEEVVSNKLILFSLRHCSKSVIFSLQLSIESLECLQNISFDFSSLLWSIDSRLKRVAGQISSNSNTSADDHCSLVSWEIRSIQFDIWILSDMLVCWFVTVISFNYSIEQLWEFVV